MRRLQLLTLAFLLSAVACTDATAPSQRPQISVPNRTLVGASTAPQISAGAYHTCAVKADGTVVCWGSNVSFFSEYYGQATVPAGLASVAQVSAGGFHTCAVKTDGIVVCWGSNAYGQTTVPDALTSVVQVSAGTQHTCALKTDGRVVCWGLNANGQATPPGGLASVAQVSAGVFHTCALKTDGTVVCWGEDFAGKLTPPAGLNSAVQVSAGANHTCALKTDGTVVCWGYNYYGGASVPFGLSSVVQVSGGGRHTCALKTDGTTVCWGNDDYGQSTVPIGLGSVVQVATGYLHTCALKTDGTVICWGHNYYGQGTVPPCLNLNTATNCPPAVGPITAPVVPVQVNTTVTASASFTDPNTLDTHTAVFDWGDGTSSTATVSEGSGAGSVSGSHVYSTAGVYTITVVVTDEYGFSDRSVFEFVVVYDPSAGFVTGEGSINSSAGAYAADPTLTGPARFAFVSRYQKGATIPSGNTQFHFQAGDLKFKSTSYDWLVVAGPQAKYKGSGTINNAGDFGFLLSAVDGAVNGGGGTDKFRIKIWNKATGSVIYDNQMGGTEDAPAATVLASGDIMIHN